MQKAAEDLISLPIEMNESIADTKFRLVHIASQRVRQLSDGAPLAVASKSIKDTTIALEEAAAGSFRILTGDEANVAKEEFRKRKEQEKIDAQLLAKEEEIRKELSAYLSDSQEEGTESSGEEGDEEVSGSDEGADGMDDSAEAEEAEE